jgi:hypothetical protein
MEKGKGDYVGEEIDDDIIFTSERLSAFLGTQLRVKDLIGLFLDRQREAEAKGRTLDLPRG